MEIDWVFLIAALLLAAIGVSALFSISGRESALAERQLVWIALGLVAMMTFLCVSYRTWGELSPLLYGLGLGALGIVLVAGHRVNGSKSWLQLAGLTFQPSELVKIFTVLLLARVAAGFRREAASPGLMLALGAVVGAPLLLVIAQPDAGTALTFAAMLGVTLAIVGLSRRTWALLVAVALISSWVGWNHLLRDYQKDRIRTFLYPETDAQATGYQIIQSRIAIGSGGVLGKGYAAGTQSQLNFIPEKHTDFVFPVVAEEWGFLGSMTVLGLYAVLFARGLRIALQARDAFGAYLVAGIMALIATHVLINLGMVTGLLPTIGIPLPLMSYGGSSMVSTLAGIGLILNVRMRRAASG
jgi:rod shape determining protein RodA